MSPFFCSTWALSLEVCALALVMKIACSVHQPIRSWLMNSPPTPVSMNVGVQADHRIGQPAGDLLDGCDHPGVGPVADRDVLGPAEKDVGDGQRPGMLALEAVAAVRDEVDLEEPRRLLHLIHRLAHTDRGPQRLSGTGRG